MGESEYMKTVWINLISKNKTESNRWGLLVKIPETGLLHLGHAPVGQTAFLPSNITLAVFFENLKNSHNLKAESYVLFGEIF